MESIGVIGPLSIDAHVERWPVIKPFRIAGHVWEHLEVLLVTLEHGDNLGRGEAAGVYYKQDTPTSMLQQINRVRKELEREVSRESIQLMLPSGGARNALDCAFWDLEAKITGRRCWQLAGLNEPQPLMSTFTCGAESPEVMARDARGYTKAKAIKIKLTGDVLDADRVRAVRAARPDVWMGVDANQGLSRNSLEKLLPILMQARVSLIEQPFPVGQEALLDQFRSPIPIAADETVQALQDIPRAAGRFDLINIKLDKCGGLTEALAMAHRCREFGLDAMVGNMMGTSLAMAPAFLVGQRCKVIDLDGPAVLKADRDTPVCYENGYISVPKGLWG